MSAFEEAKQKVDLALKLLDSETADAIIGKPPPDAYGALIRGMEGCYHMLWAMGKGAGLRQTPETLRMGSQALAVMLTLIHYAFALGVRHGRGEEERANEHPDGNTP